MFISMRHASDLWFVAVSAYIRTSNTSHIGVTEKAPVILIRARQLLSGYK